MHSSGTQQNRRLFGAKHTLSLNLLALKATPAHNQRLYIGGPSPSLSVSCAHTVRPWRPLGVSQPRTLNPRASLALDSFQGALFRMLHLRGTWVARSVEHPTLAQVMISRFVSLSPALGSALTAQSLQCALDSVSLSLCPSPAHALSLSQK